MALLPDSEYVQWKKKTDPKVPYFHVRNLNVTQALATVTNSYTVPFEYDFILCHIMAVFSSGAGQTANVLQLNCVVPGVAGAYLDWKRPAVPLQYDTLSFEGELHVSSGSVLQAIGDFSGGANPNTVELTFAGYLIHPMAVSAL